jgi:hypothetical protein
MSSLIRVVLEISKMGSVLVLVKILLDFSAITLIAKHIRQNSSLQEGQLLYLTCLKYQKWAVFVL